MRGAGGKGAGGGWAEQAEQAERKCWQLLASTDPGAEGALVLAAAPGVALLSHGDCGHRSWPK